jgi:5-hydroxyisourate hydrolase
MATISSHILDSVSGKSVVGIRVELVRIVSESERQTIFDILSDKEGRISETVDAQDCEYELIFHSADYFSVDHSPVSKAIIRFKMRDKDKRYHMPMMLAPHSHSLWWSV